MDQQRSHPLFATRAHTSHEGRFSAVLGQVGIRPGTQEFLHDDGIPVDTGQGKRRHPVDIGRIDIGPGLDQQLHRLQIVPVNRPSQCRRTIGLGDIHIHRSFEQETHRLPVPFSDGIDQIQCIAGNHTGDRQHDQDPPDQQFLNDHAHTPSRFHSGLMAAPNSKCSFIPSRWRGYPTYRWNRCTDCLESPQREGPPFPGYSSAGWTKGDGDT